MCAMCADMWNRKGLLMLNWSKEDNENVHSWNLFEGQTCSMSCYALGRVQHWWFIRLRLKFKLEIKKNFSKGVERKQFLSRMSVHVILSLPSKSKNTLKATKINRMQIPKNRRYKSRRQIKELQMWNSIIFSFKIMLKRGCMMHAWFMIFGWILKYFECIKN